MATRAPSEQGKMTFAEQFLAQNHDANVIKVNEAWRAAGHSGSISRSAVGKLRAKLGLTDPTRARRRPATSATATADRSPGPRHGEANGQRPASPAKPAPKASAADRNRTVEQLEADIDRVVFQVMALGGLSEVEDTLRRARRLLVLAARP